MNAPAEIYVPALAVTDQHIRKLLQLAGLAFISNRARCLDAIDQQSIGFWHVVFENGRAERGANALRFQQVLMRNGKSVERAEEFAPRG